MKLPIVRLIAGREIRDLLRDRRSITLLVLLPILLYPGIGLTGFYAALETLDRQSVIGVAGIDNLPAKDTIKDADLPPLLQDGQIVADYVKPLGKNALQLTALGSDATAALDDKKVDAMLIVPDEFANKLLTNESQFLEIRDRRGDEASQMAARRLSVVLNRYEDAVRKARFARKGLPENFDQPWLIRQPRDADSPVQQSTDEVRDLIAKFLPFMLIMWAMVGALYPAIDLCAGEKERGTMETLLISPAERTEVVAGKFLAIWCYATVTTWWNLLWMFGLAVLGSWYFSVQFVSTSGMAWCFMLTLPITALFSALCLALGVYARSTKEGQYYLLPMFLVALPLVMYSLMPGTELTLGTSVVPITGVCLLIQKLAAPNQWDSVAPYVAPLLASLAVCVGLACWWAVAQFRRESVLFRESEGGGMRAMLADIGPPRAGVSS